jgi:glutaredoxin 3
MNVTPTVIELDRMKNGLGAGEDSIALKLLHLYGQSTVPNVFIKGQHIGTNDDVQAKARSGELQKLLMG